MPCCCTEILPAIQSFALVRPLPEAHRKFCKAGKALKFRSLRNQASTPKLCCFLSPCPDGIFYFAYGFLHLTFSLPQHATSFGLFITCRFAYFALGSASSIFHFPLQFILVHYNAPKRCGVSRRQLDDRARREFASYQNRSYGIAEETVGNSKACRLSWAALLPTAT
jgi:hypothetical protein